MEFIKNTNFETKINVKIFQSLPQVTFEGDIIIVQSSGIYECKNNQWVLLISFIKNDTNKIIGEVKASIGQPNSDWLECNGGTFTQSEYPELYSLLGGNTLPDFREVIPVGVGQNNSDTIAVHDVYNLGQIKDRSLQNHSHSVTETAHTHSLSSNCPSHCHSYYYWRQTVECKHCMVAYYFTKKTVNSTSSNYGTLTICSCTPSVVICNPSGASTYLRTNAYGVKFYIRAK